MTPLRKEVGGSRKKMKSSPVQMGETKGKRVPRQPSRGMSTARKLKDKQNGGGRGRKSSDRKRKRNRR